MIRAYVHPESFGPTLAVSILNEQPGELGEPPFRRILRLNGSDMLRTWEEIDYSASLQPTFTLHHDEAHAVLTALANHYQGIDDQRALRKDYDDERGRVDKLINALIEITTEPAQPDPPVTLRPSLH